MFFHTVQFFYENNLHCLAIILHNTKKCIFPRDYGQWDWACIHKLKSLSFFSIIFIEITWQREYTFQNESPNACGGSYQPIIIIEHICESTTEKSMLRIIQKSTWSIIDIFFNCFKIQTSEHIGNNHRSMVNWSAWMMKYLRHLICLRFLHCRILPQWYH